ncbi:MAG: YbaB/EbfC family nucleoid-associated protein [Saccharothrix sp.]|nr:YbaB/EbfC family nucleoid-associated protein [Saccharothrix sp.]
MTGHEFGGVRTEQEAARWAAAVAAESERYQRLGARVAEVVVRGSGGDGLVEVTVGASGVLLDLEISDRAREVPGAELAAAIMAATRSAQSRIAGAVSEIAHGAGVAAEDAEALVSTYRQRFPEPVPGPPPWADRVRPARPARRPVVEDDEEWDGPAVTE